jgi:hypothetical protein
VKKDEKQGGVARANEQGRDETAEARLAERNAGIESASAADFTGSLEPGERQSFFLSPGELAKISSGKRPGREDWREPPFQQAQRCV